jgi:ABC-type cobalamin/Fe3+-siderophores transport system ATPase subunit
MDIDITFSGYRCFSPQHPVTLSLREDTIALIGINNSGKSTLLKAVYEFRDIFVQLSQATGNVTAAMQQGANFQKAPETGDIAELFWHFGASDLQIDVVLPSLENPQSPTQVWRAEIRIEHNSDKYFAVFTGPSGRSIQGRAPGMIMPNNLPVASGAGSLDEMFRAFRLLAESFYFPSVRHVTSFAPDSGETQGRFYDIFSGKSFIGEWALNQQGKSKTYTQIIREITNDIKKIFRYQDLEIIADQNRRNILIVADGKSLRLGELGTGLAQFIILLGNIAFRTPSYVFVDEPESNLHPTLQLQFVQSIASRSRFGLVFATHSLGLARQAADRVYALTREFEECHMTKLAETTDLARLIGELSFGRADSLGTRRLLLVEGPTDIMTFEAILSALNKEHEFAILPLNGDAGIHAGRQNELEHLIAINPNVLAIIDSEKKDQGEALRPNRKAFIEICGRLGIKCHVLERRAIENYFPDRAIKAAFPKHSYRELKHFEPIKNIAPSWGKKDNWRIARLLRKTDIEATDFGQFLTNSLK